LCRFDTASSKGEDYAGDRNKRAIIKFVRGKHGKAAPLVWPITTLAAADAFAADNEAFAVGLVAEADSDFDEALVEAASKLADLEIMTVRIMGGADADADALRARFFPSLAADVAEAFAVETRFGGVRAVAHLPATEETAETAALVAFAIAQATPPVTAFGPESQGRLFAHSIKTHALLFIDAKARGAKKALAAFTALAEAERAGAAPQRALFVSVDPASNAGVLDYFGVKAEDAPLLAVAWVPEGKAPRKFVMPKAGPLTRQAMSAFLDSVAAGESKPALKSAEPPAGDREEAFGDITVVVGSSFERIVLDTTKDVLLEVYAPWCGHCKNLAPIYKEAAAALKSVETLVVANMDGTANEFFFEGIEVKGYPTLAFFPASLDGSKKAGKYYDGASGDAASIAAWLSKNAAHTFSLAGLALPAPKVKSEPAPTAEEAAASDVVTAVGTTVEGIALDPSKVSCFRRAIPRVRAPQRGDACLTVTAPPRPKRPQDVLLEFYAPWCGHCKALAPVFESLATKLKAREGWRDVVLAKLDATANDYHLDGVKVEGFPTLYFFPATTGAAKAAPTLYTSARDEAAFEAFLAANAKTVAAGDEGDEEL
jgi:protein disulfide-isomerase A1